MRAGRAGSKLERTPPWPAPGRAIPAGTSRRRPAPGLERVRGRSIIGLSALSRAGQARRWSGVVERDTMAVDRGFHGRDSGGGPGGTAAGRCGPAGPAPAAQLRHRSFRDPAVLRFRPGNPTSARSARYARRSAGTGTRRRWRCACRERSSRQAWSRCVTTRWPAPAACARRWRSHQGAERLRGERRTMGAHQNRTSTPSPVSS